MAVVTVRGLSVLNTFNMLQDQVFSAPLALMIINIVCISWSYLLSTEWYQVFEHASLVSKGLGS